MKEAIDLYVDALTEDGLPLPEPTTKAKSIVVAAEAGGPDSFARLRVAAYASKTWPPRTTEGRSVTIYERVETPERCNMTPVPNQRAR